MEALPTPLREHAYDDLTGRGVVVAFLDAGFSPHPDLTRPENRILHYHDATGEGVALDDPPETGAWHGTQASVVGSGNGFLSSGRFRSLVPEARVVLVRVATRSLLVGEDQVARGLEWVLDNHERFGIRVVNVSVGAGDFGGPFESSRVDLLAEEAVRRGLVVVAAAGNRGSSDDPQTIPPANAPSVIAAGGYDDHEDPDDPDDVDLYDATSFGITPDGYLKPEVLAPAVGVAAPLLTHTGLYARAEAAVRLAQASAENLRRVLDEVREPLGLPEDARYWPDEALWDAAWRLIDEEGLVDAHYKEVDGTSFAAPIVCSIVAQMLEANPALTPREVKKVLISASARLHGVPMERQGFGRVCARRAVDLARRVDSRVEAQHGPPAMHHGRLVVHFYGPDAARMDLAGDFDGWALHPMARADDGFWRAEVPVSGPGRYRYKFLVDGVEWLEDPANLHVEPDGFGGFNSVLEVR